MLSLTDIKASSVALIITGRTIITDVKIPDNNEYWNFIKTTKKSIPNRPNTIDGIPANVSAAIRISLTHIEPFLAYSTK
ncbi:Phosphate transport system permease protein [Streptococcus parauberis KRS-02109]|nr:Phosphate transport system permease protein [Streptococcus parauberis KRS-02109]